LRALQGFDCDRPDPLKSERMMGWLKGELGSRKQVSKPDTP
jgi:hypothetical protein